MKNYYKILGLTQNATDEQIKRNYRTLAKRYHPDVNQGNNAAEQKFADINEANSVLSDISKRAEYDKKLRDSELNTQSNSYYNSSNNQNDGFSYAERMRIQAQMQAQINAQVQAQLKGVRDRAYAEGYEKGKHDGKALSKQVYGQQAALNKQKAREYAHDRSELEEELFVRNRELGKANERISELESRLNWFRKAVSGEDLITGVLYDELQKAQSHAEELKTQIDRLGISHINVKGEPAAQLDKQKRIKCDIAEVEKRIASLSREIDEWKAKIRTRKQVAEADRLILEAERKARDWALKQKADLKAAKSTHYGALGLLIWATDDEINKKYAELTSQYAKKNDAESAANMQKIKNAYAILSNPKRRKEYNISLGYDDAKIETERNLIRANAKAQSDYRSILATKAFWLQFDELSALALSGDRDAQNALGELYYSGNTVERDYVQAVYWFKEAAAQKHAAALYNLGACYTLGNGVKRNRSIGQGYLRQAENLGYRKNK